MLLQIQSPKEPPSFTLYIFSALVLGCPWKSLLFKKQPWSSQGLRVNAGLLEQDVHNQTQTAAAELELILRGLLSPPSSLEVRLPVTRPAPTAGPVCFQDTANNIFCGLHSQNANRFLCFALSCCLSRFKYFKQKSGWCPHTKYHI